jgi:DNA-binding CsgD family transcriptional regulator
MKLWSANQNFSQALIDSNQLFGIDNKFEIATITDDYTEIFGWGGRSGDISIIEFYLNNISTLMSFGYYFKEKAMHIIKNAAKSSNLIPINIASHVDTHQTNILKNYLDLHTKRYYINNHVFDNEEYLTKRELETLLLTIQGKNSREISKKLGISDATVRSYLESVRIKTNSSNKEELIINSNRLNILKLIE